MTLEAYVNAYDCGHRTWKSPAAAPSLAWCFACQSYVGVIVSRVDRQAAS